MDNSIKDKVLEATDILDVIRPVVSLTRKGKDHVGLCPFHNDHKPSLSVSSSKQIFKCWSCGAGGDAIAFVQKFHHLEFREALAMLADRAGIRVGAAGPEARDGELREKLFAASAWASQHFQRNLAGERGRGARDYAASRGVAPATMARFGMGYALDAWDDILAAARRTGLRPEILQQSGLVASKDSGRIYDRFRHRLIFPICDAGGRPIAFGGRALGDDPAKYLNSPETSLFSKSRVLYGLPQARAAVRAQDTAIIVEGYLDAVMLHQHGFENVLATLGTALTDAHVKILRSLARKVILCFDGDDAGRRAAQRGVEVALRTNAEVWVVLLAGDKDPADCVKAGGHAAFAAQLNRAVEALEFKWQQVVTAYGAGGQAGRRRAAEEFLQFVAGATLGGGLDPLDQGLLVGRLSELVRLPEEEVFGLLGRFRRAQRHGDGRTATSLGAAQTAYKKSIAGLSGGLVTAAEAILGLLAARPECWQWVTDAVAQGLQHSQTWERLWRLVLEVHEDAGQYSIGEVLARCEDSELADLVSQWSERVAGFEDKDRAFVAARDRLAEELDVLRGGESLDRLRASGGESAHDFNELCARSRGKSRVLPLERGRSAGAA
jgi:DNA primase